MIDFATFDEVDVEDKTKGNEDDEATEENTGKMPDQNQYGEDEDEDDDEKPPKIDENEE